MKDLVLLVADKSMEFALSGALNRPPAMGIRAITLEIFVHSNRDGGVRKTGPDVLRLKRSAASHALLVLDHEGSGSAIGAPELEAELEARLQQTWGDAAKALVIEPELDAWMWGSDNALQSVVEWEKPESIRAWLRSQGYVFEPNDKPVRPKEALQAALRESGIPRSAALYKEIASKISLKKCEDRAFKRLRLVLQQWFPATPHPPM